MSLFHKLKIGILVTTREFLGTHQLYRQVKTVRFEQRRNQLAEHILHDKERGVTDEKYFDHQVIVSLTTYGKRLYDVAFTIESIMQQSVKANKIVLWLEEGLRGKPLPQSLINQQRRGLEIDFCKDIRSYKKLIPSIQKYPNDAIITIDDDLLYEYDMVEQLISEYREQPRYIHCCRKHKMLKSESYLKPYAKWTRADIGTGANRMNFFTGGAGTLYPPHSLDDEVLNEGVFMDICKFADDVWFNAMAIKKGTLVNKIYTRDPHGEGYLVNDDVQDIGLKKINLYGDNLNDQQIKAVFTRYNIYELLK